MEDVLEVYQRAYDPLNPVVCIDEANKQLIEETRVPCEPGQPEKVDSVYVRKGVADVFMICEPLAGKRETVITRTRTTLDFAQILQYTSDMLYPRAEKLFLLRIISIRIRLRLSTRPSRRKRPADSRSGLSGIIHPNMEVGWIWLKLRLASCAVRL